MRHVLAAPVLALLAGAAIGLHWPDIPSPFLIAALLAWAALAVDAMRSQRPALLMVAAGGAFAVGGTLLASDAWHRAWRPSLRIVFESIARDQRSEALRAGRNPPDDDTAAVVLTGILTGDAGPTASGAVSLALQVDGVGRVRAAAGDDAAVNPVSGGVLLAVVGALGVDHMSEWTAGRRIRAPAELRRVARYLDPGVPDQERSLARRGITLVGTVKSGALVEVLERGSRVAETAAALRAFTRRAIDASVAGFSVRSAAIVKAIVIGDRTGLDDEVQRRLQEAGTYHVIAISGGNIAILAGLTLAAFRFAGVLGRIAMLSAAGGLAAYGYLVGGGASVTRATLMAVVYFAGRAWDLRGPPLHALLLVAGVMVVLDPLSVADPASLLTFGATAGIVVISSALPVGRLPPLVVPAAAMFVASAAAEVTLLPVSATLFSRITFAGLVLNFGAIPLMAVAQLAGMALVPLFAVWERGAWMLGWIAHLGAEGLVRTANLVALAPWSTWRVTAPPLVVTAVYYGALAALWKLSGVTAPGVEQRLRLRRARGALAAAAVIAALAIVTGPLHLRAQVGDGRLHVTFIDVGQGDAALVRFPQGAAIEIDAGGLPGGASFDLGDRVVAPVLRSAGVGVLSSLLLTHGDADHIGGALSVLREFRPFDVWEGVPVPPLESLQALRAEALRQRARWTTLQRADRLSIDGVDIVVHHPTLPDWERQDSRNNDSVVLELRWRDVSCVFTGDIEREAESELVDRFAPARLRVVKVPHHGSNTSSTAGLVRALAPAVAVVSVGRANNFGHPSPLVLARYADAGAAIFRTDRDGAVTVDTDGTWLEVHTFTGRSQSFDALHSSRGHEGTKDGKR
jgi:competence protein ComEC